MPERIGELIGFELVASFGFHARNPTSNARAAHARGNDAAPTIGRRRFDRACETAGARRLPNRKYRSRCALGSRPTHPKPKRPGAAKIRKSPSRPGFLLPDGHSLRSAPFKRLPLATGRATGILTACPTCREPATVRRVAHWLLTRSLQGRARSHTWSPPRSAPSDVRNLLLALSHGGGGRRHQRDRRRRHAADVSGLVRGAGDFGRRVGDGQRHQHRGARSRLAGRDLGLSPRTGTRPSLGLVVGRPEPGRRLHRLGLGGRRGPSRSKWPSLG